MRLITNIPNHTKPHIPIPTFEIHGNYMKVFYNKSF